jgi:hypothetical protein
LQACEKTSPSKSPQLERLSRENGYPFAGIGRQTPAARPPQACRKAQPPAPGNKPERKMLYIMD